METGTSVHPFTFTLPENLPSSFRSLDNVGRVLYQITARLKKPWFSYDIFATIPFQVCGMLELVNIFPNMKQPFILERASRTKKFSAYYCQCFRRGSSLIYCKLRLPQRIFNPGDVVPVQIEVSNEAGNSYANNVASLSLTLVQNIVYRTRRHRLEASFEICQAILCPGQEAICENNGGYLMLLKIPLQSCPTKLGGHCKLINLHYVLKVNIK